MDGGAYRFDRRRFVAGSLLAMAERVSVQWVPPADKAHPPTNCMPSRSTGRTLNLVIQSLASNSPYYPGQIARIGLLGSEPNLEWSRSPDGATVKLPPTPPCEYAWAFRINSSKT